MSRRGRARAHLLQSHIELGHLRRRLVPRGRAQERFVRVAQVIVRDPRDAPESADLGVLDVVLRAAGIAPRHLRVETRSLR